VKGTAHIIQHESPIRFQDTIDLSEYMILARLREEVDDTVRENTIDRVGLDGQRLSEQALDEADMRGVQSTFHSVVSRPLDHVLKLKFQ
jgi:hypothetical protein